MAFFHLFFTLLHFFSFTQYNYILFLQLFPKIWVLIYQPRPIPNITLQPHFLISPSILSSFISSPPSSYKSVFLLSPHSYILFFMFQHLFLFISFLSSLINLYPPISYLYLFFFSFSLTIFSSFHLIFLSLYIQSSIILYFLYFKFFLSFITSFFFSSFSSLIHIIFVPLSLYSSFKLLLILLVSFIFTLNRNNLH